MRPSARSKSHDIVDFSKSQQLATGSGTMWRRLKGLSSIGTVRLCVSSYCDVHVRLCVCAYINAFNQRPGSNYTPINWRPFAKSQPETWLPVENTIISPHQAGVVSLGYACDIYHAMLYTPIHYDFRTGAVWSFRVHRLKLSVKEITIMSPWLTWRSVSHPA